MDVQQDFDALVADAERWLLADNPFAPESIELEAKIEAARRADSGIAEAAIDKAFRNVAPVGLVWNS